MNNIVIKNIIRFFGLILFQVLILNNINLSGYLNPYVYILFIAILPATLNRSLLLLLAFITGITVDYFGNTLGLHSSACVAMAFIRPATIQLFFRNYEFGKNEDIMPFSIGYGGFFRYLISLTFFHQFILFFLEILSFKHFFMTLGKISLTTVSSVFVMLIIVLIFGKRRRRI